MAVAVENPLTRLSDLDNFSSTTIAAPATATGRGGVAIIRLSGKNSLEIAQKISRKCLTPRQVHFSSFYDHQDNVIDEGVILYFMAPHSFTGEDVVEFQTHGSPIVLDLLLKELIYQGAVMAQPGEFSQRAFLNNKCDLTQAEAIADLIQAQSEQAARGALRSLQGVFSKKIFHLVEMLIAVRVFVEAAIDFPDEEIDFLHLDQIIIQLQEVLEKIFQIFQEANRGRLLQEGMTLVIAGKPNAGKSSLLNQLAGDEVAIVTHIPGTTRDVIKQTIHLEGLPLHIVDTAGLRETQDVVEQEGIKRTITQIHQADRILLVVDANHIDLTQALEDFWPQDILNMPAKNKITLVCNKIDLLSVEESKKILQKKYDVDMQMISTKTQEGLQALRDYLKKSVGFVEVAEQNTFSARRRHLVALENTTHHIKSAVTFIEGHVPYELIAEELRLAQRELNTITGEFSSDDLLGEIFSSFCIGK